MTASPRDPARRLVARSEAMRRLLAEVERLAGSASPVLITGESGTGKELVARLLHRSGPRRAAPFVPVNCGAIPETLVESELFGHRKGAFTGAIHDRVGLLEQAHGGVIFLDEIGEMLPSMQVRLLRFIEDGEVRRIGASAIRHVDARVVAATHRALDAEIARGRFREDLFYRIGVLRLHVPPLRDRGARHLARARRQLSGVPGDARGAGPRPTHSAARGAEPRLRQRPCPCWRCSACSAACSPTTRRGKRTWRARPPFSGRSI